MSSSGKKKKTQKLPRRPVVSGIKVNNDDYVQVNVGGDGNCFYYSIYGAAKYHVDPTVFPKLLACFEIKNKPTLTPQEFSQKVRVKLAREILKPHGIMEAQEAVAVEHAEPLRFQAQSNGNLFTMMHEASKHIWDPEDTFEYKDLSLVLEENQGELDAAKAEYRAAATSAEKRVAINKIKDAMRLVRKGKQNLKDIMEPRGRREHWQSILELVSREIGTHPLLKNPFAYKTMTKQKFKKEFTKLLAGNKLDGQSFMYASQPDVEIMRFFLSRCGTPLNIIPINPRRDTITDSTNGVPNLNILLMFREMFEHYNFYVRGDQYATHIGTLRQNTHHVKIQHVSKGNTPITPNSPNSSESNSNNSSLSSLSSVSSNSLSPASSNSLSPASSNSLSPASSNSSSSTRKQKEDTQKKYALLAKKRAELEPSPAKNVRAQLNATKRNSTALYASPSHKNVHTTLKQKGPYNNLAAQLAEIPVRKRIGVKGELARIKEMARKLQQERNNAALAASLAEAPAPAPPRSMSPGEKAAIQEVANAQKAAAASMRPSSSRGRTNTRRVPKTPSPSPGAKAAIQEVENAKKAATKTPSILQSALAKLLGKKSKK